MLYRLVRIGEKRNRSTGSGECSSLEKLCTCRSNQTASNKNVVTDNHSLNYFVYQRSISLAKMANCTIVTCIGTGMCNGVTFRRSAGADFGRYRFFSCTPIL